MLCFKNNPLQSNHAYRRASILKIGKNPVFNHFFIWKNSIEKKNF